MSDYQTFRYSCHGMTIYEGATAFYISRGKEERCMGDGVDMLMDENDKPFHPGTPEFNEALKSDFRAHWQDYKAAYFGG